MARSLMAKRLFLNWSQKVHLLWEQPIVACSKMLYASLGVCSNRLRDPGLVCPKHERPSVEFMEPGHTPPPPDRDDKKHSHSEEEFFTVVDISTNP